VLTNGLRSKRTGKSRWQVELFFKWIKQHLRIKKFYGTSENAVKSQIWIAVSVYVLVKAVQRYEMSRISSRLSMPDRAAR
jgi:IS4 transposase